MKLLNIMELCLIQNCSTHLLWGKLFAQKMAMKLSNWAEKRKKGDGNEGMLKKMENEVKRVGQKGKKCKENQRIYLNNQIINLITSIIHLKRKLYMSEQSLERIKNRIQQLGRPEEIEQLCLDGIQIDKFSLSICSQLIKCTNVLYLTLNHCEISTLQNFPLFPSLLALQLIGNHISSDEFVHLKYCQKIQHLALDQNQIKTVQHLKSLNNLPEIQHLQIRRNPICTLADYRAKIFETIPNLKIVDSQDIFGDQEVMFGTDTDSEASSLGSDDEEEEKIDQCDGSEDQSEGQYQKKSHKRKNY